MKIGCDACGRAAAAVLCCADEAALCRRCDAAVHSANRLAGRHQRLHLLSSSPPATCSSSLGAAAGTHPSCDICQEKTGYFFCVEDRALLCRSCDVAVHTATAQASSHRRFLITGVRVGGAAQHDHTTNDAAIVVSPSSSSANGSSSSRTRSLANIAHDDRRSAQAAARLLGVGGEDDEEEAAAQQQWPWSDIFAVYDDRQCYNGLLSEPAGSSGLTG